MQLTRFSDYALRVLMFIANRNGAPTTIREVSEAHQISEGHLMKVVHRLSKLGYLTSVRGKGGGIKSARPPAEISIGSVIRDIEPLAPVECFATGYDGHCILYPNCGLRGVLESAQSHFLMALDACSLADVLPKRSSRKAKSRQPGDIHARARHTPARSRVKGHADGD